MAHALICAVTLWAPIFSLVFSSVSATECNITCVNGDCVSDSTDQVQIFRCGCHTNWFGDNCTEFICNNTAKYPCKNNGTCHPQANFTSFNCSCGDQYSGEHCEFSHFNCTNVSCNGNATCLDNSLLPAGYECRCDAGFTGVDCETNIDDCDEVDCYNGTCVDGINGYICKCNVNYTGSHCNLIDYCAIHTADQSHGCNHGVCCANGGTCINNHNGHTCDCTGRWLPTFGCRRAYEPCASNPCQNNGSCNTHGNQYTCICLADFTGVNCEIELVECVNNTCHNNATCIGRMNNGSRTEHCECPLFYTGRLCEEHIDPCTGKCWNNGTCEPRHNNGEYSGICSCTEHFTGENCTEDINECSVSNPCQNNATCANTYGSFNCTCRDGFMGERCETNINDCVGVVCRNNGTCVDLVNDFQCDCTQEYSGKYCQWHYDETCNGSHNTGNGCFAAHTTKCVDNYDGIAGSDRSFECHCMQGYIGELCQAKVVHCQNTTVCGGPERKLNCTDGEDDYYCECRFGYAGDRCEIDVDLCENSTCRNSGTCEDHGNYFTCQCPPGYSGNDCSLILCNNTDINYCGDNSISCTDRPSGPVCTCMEGYTGRRCETVFNPCNGNPCFNGATCIQQGNSYSCNCSEGYSGTNCTICSMKFCHCPVDDCAAKANNGICNEECRNKECHWDNDECVPTYKPPSGLPTIPPPPDPWARCTMSEDGVDCQDLFDNGVCNSPCANADCLLDGTDCFLKNKTCPRKAYCEVRYQNGQCTKDCNNEACQYDGGDCEEAPTRIFVKGLLIVLLVLPPGEMFEGIIRNEFLIALGNILNCIPIEEESYKIGDAPARVKRQSSGTDNRWNVTLNLDVTNCEDPCIESASEASDIVNVHLSRGFTVPGYNISGVYSVESDQKEEKKSSFPLIYAVIPIAVVLVLVVIGVVVGVKRKRASATWHPNDKRNSKADGERDTPSPLRRRSTMGEPVGQEETLSLRSIRDEDVENNAKKFRQRGPTYAWVDVEPSSISKDCKRHPGKETSFISQEAEDVRLWSNLQYSDMRDYNRLKSALQLMEQKNGHCIDVNAKGPGGYTRLMIGVMQSSVAVMRGSLESKEEPMPEGAVANACLSIKDLLDLHPDVNAKNDRGQTALHIATACCTSDAVQKLIEAGADINAQDDDGWTPLHVAVGTAAHNVFRILLCHKGLAIDAQDHNGMTALILSSKDCAVVMAKQLLDRQAEPGVADNKGKTALHWAAAVNNVDGIRLLLQSNANKDVQDHRGQSPLFLAAREGHIEAVKLLLECFANRNIVDNMDRSPMMIAEERKHSAVARMLGEWNITALSHDGTVVQALAHVGHMAATMTSPSVVRRRQPADSFFAHQMDTPHPNVPQAPYDAYCSSSSGTATHQKMEFHSPLEYHHLNSDHNPIGSSGASTSIQPSVSSMHDQLSTAQMSLHNSNGHIMPSISVANGSLSHLLPPRFSPPGNAPSLAVSRVNSNSSGSPPSVLSPSNTSPLTHIDEPLLPPVSSYPPKASIAQTVPSYQRSNAGNETYGNDTSNALLTEHVSFPTPPSALGCDATYPYSPLALSAADSVYLTPPPDPDSPERWSPGKGKSPNMNDLSRPMTNIPLGIVTEEPDPPPPYRPLPCTSAYPIGGH